MYSTELEKKMDKLSPIYVGRRGSSDGNTRKTEIITEVTKGPKVKTDRSSKVLYQSLLKNVAYILIRSGSNF